MAERKGERERGGGGGGGGGGGRAHLSGKQGAEGRAGLTLMSQRRVSVESTSCNPR